MLSNQQFAKYLNQCHCGRMVCNVTITYVRLLTFQEENTLLVIAAEMGQEMAMLSLLDSKADVAFKQEVTS